jgi:alkanesulfonate monooxygenase SsuD/methylene tetrahydromethanopterin reductase-like flavin-dependent oxidoreductase (luciferase family)
MLFRHPAMHARLFAQVDEASNGRVIAGVGAGWTRAEFEMMGIDFPDVSERLENVLAVAAGGFHTCAILGDRSVSCWGFNEDNQVGLGPSDPRPTPATVAGVSMASSVSAGRTFTCAILEDSTAQCWRRNGAGQLGNGTFESSHAPTFVVEEL